MQLTPQDAWEALAAFLRDGVQRLVQQLLEEEISETLARQRGTGRAEPRRAGTRSGHGRPRRLRTLAGDLSIRRPRVRGMAAGFRSDVLPSFIERFKQAGRPQMEQYLAGVASADFDRALSGLLGGPPPLSENATARLRRGWLREQQLWRSCPLGELKPRFIWIDRLGIAMGGRHGADPTRLLVAIACLPEEMPRVLALEPCSQSPSTVLSRLRERGLPAAQLVVGGGDLAPPPAGRGPGVMRLA
jgi:putative transposase